MSTTSCVPRRSVVSDSLQPPWTAARQAPLSMGSLQAAILEWVAISCSSGSSQPRDGTCVSQVSAVAGGLLTVNITWEGPTVPHMRMQILTFMFPSLLVLSVTSSFLMRSLFRRGRRQTQRHSEMWKHSRSTAIKATLFGRDTRPVGRASCWLNIFQCSYLTTVEC